MSHSNKTNRLSKRPDAVRRRRGGNVLHTRMKPVYVLPLFLSWSIIFMLAGALVFMFSKKSAENMQAKVENALRQQEQLEKKLEREKNAWDLLTTPEQLRTALLNNGIRMYISPNPSQVVAMGRLQNYYEPGVEPEVVRYVSR